MLNLFVAVYFGGWVKYRDDTDGMPITACPPNNTTRETGKHNSPSPD